MLLEQENADQRRFFDVYVAELPEGDVGMPLSSPTRQQKIDATVHPVLKRQRYYVWRLLEYALMKTFGISAVNLSFELTESGKWTASNVCFSLSHSGNALAVAVSREEVGVDIEKVAPPRSETFPQRILNENEYQTYLLTEDGKKNTYLIGRWTEKESVFKLGGYACFSPKDIPTDACVYNGTIKLKEDMYCLSAAAATKGEVRIYRVAADELCEKGAR